MRFVIAAGLFRTVIGLSGSENQKQNRHVSSEMFVPIARYADDSNARIRRASVLICFNLLALSVSFLSASAARDVHPSVRGIAPAQQDSLNNRPLIGIVSQVITQ